MIKLTRWAEVNPMAWADRRVGSPRAWSGAGVGGGTEAAGGSAGTGWPKADYDQAFVATSGVVGGFRVSCLVCIVPAGWG